MKTKFLQKCKVNVLIISMLALFATVFSLQAQENTISISGTVIDSETRRPMVFASISIQDIGISIVTNGEGFFTLKFPKEYADRSITISYLGYHRVSCPLRNFGVFQTIDHWTHTGCLAHTHDNRQAYRSSGIGKRSV